MFIFYLCLIRRISRIAGLSISVDKPEVRVSAYADDVNIFVTNDSFTFIEEPLCLYEQNSNASINILTFNGMWCSSWKYRQNRPLEMLKSVHLPSFNKNMLVMIDKVEFLYLLTVFFQIFVINYCLSTAILLVRIGVVNQFQSVVFVEQVLQLLDIINLKERCYISA